MAMAWQASWNGTVRSTAPAVRLRACPVPDNGPGTTGSAALDPKDIGPGYHHVPLSGQGHAPRVIKVGVQGFPGRELQELDLCRQLAGARLTAIGKDAPSLEHAPAVIGKQPQHPVLIGAERGFRSQPCPQQDTEAYRVLGHPASMHQRSCAPQRAGPENVLRNSGRGLPAANGQAAQP